MQLKILQLKVICQPYIPHVNQIPLHVITANGNVDRLKITLTCLYTILDSSLKSEISCL